MALVPQLIKLADSLKNCYKWGTGLALMLVSLTFGVEHGAGVEGGEAAAKRAARGVLRATATCV